MATTKLNRASGKPKVPSKGRAASTPRKRAAAKRDSTEHAPVSPESVSPETLLRNACVRAGTAAAVGSLSARIPVLGWVAPSVLSIFTDKLSVKQIQDDLIRDLLAQAEAQFTLREQAAVALLARTAQIGTQQLSQRTLDALLRPLGNSGLAATLGRTLPMAAIAADILAAVASTWLVGQRTRAMCQLPGQQGTSATDVLSSLSGIDQKRLLGWSAEALKQVVLPLRSLLNLLRKA